MSPSNVSVTLGDQDGRLLLWPQVILIRSEESRARLPRELLESKAIIMTVQQSKGLEFDDVFLVDFFAGG